MSTPTCMLSGEPITEANNSRAHIIPSALGGRLKPFDLLTEDANGELNDKVDLPLIRAFQPLMVWIGGSRDSGKTPPVRMKDENGRSYEVNFNEPLRLSKPEYKTEKTEEGVRIEITARTHKELRTLLGRVKKDFPDFDVEEAIQRHQLVSKPLEGFLHTQLQIGPNVTFPAAFAAASIFAAYHKQSPHHSFAEYVHAIDAEADRSTIPMPPETFFWHTARPWSVADAKAAHVIGFVGNASRQQAICCVEYFGVISVATLLPYAKTTDFTALYAVDVISGREVSGNIDAALFADTPWQATHALGDEALYADVQDRIAGFMEVARKRELSHAIGDVFDETFGPADGKALTNDDISALSENLAVLFARIVGR
ncbi:MAG: HNH endonuclease [Burkholderiales bacterium]|nr:MAG: HNH endonuclease [Burkholderiales bacterium]